MPDPFVPMHQLSPTSSTPPAAERPRRAGGKKKSTSGRLRKAKEKDAAGRAYAATEAAVTPAPKKPRKPRVAKADKAVVRRVLDIGAIISATAGLKPDDARALVKIHTMLSERSAKSRVAITASLGKLFG